MLHGDGAGAGGEEGGDGYTEVEEDLSAPAHHDVHDYASGLGPAWGIPVPLRKEGLDSNSQVVVVAVVRRLLLLSGCRVGEEVEEGRVEIGRNGGREMGGNDEYGVAERGGGGEACAEVDAGEEMALAEEWQH